MVRAGRRKAFSYQWGAKKGCGRNCHYISTTIAGLLPPPSHFPVLFHHEASCPVRKGQRQCADTWNEVELRICLHSDHGRLVTDERRSRVKSNSGASFLAQWDAKFNINLNYNISVSPSYICNLRLNVSEGHYRFNKKKFTNQDMIRKTQKHNTALFFYHDT